MSSISGINCNQCSTGGPISMRMRNVIVPTQILGLLLIAVASPLTSAAQEQKKGSEGHARTVSERSVSVDVTNTPNVRVSGTASVAIKNDNSAPVITRHAKEPEPFVVASQNTTTPLDVVLPSTTASGAKVKTVKIEFITSDCDAAPGTMILGAARLFVSFANNLVTYALPSGPPVAFSNSSEFVSAQQTLIFADPGSTLEYGFAGGGGTCQVVFSGYLIPL